MAHRIICLVTAFALTGCAVTNPNSPISALARQDVANATRWGAIIGFVAHEFIPKGHKIGNVEVRDLVPVVTTMAGHAFGEMIAKRRLQYASEKEYLESEIAATKNAISKKRQQISSLKEKVSQTRREISEMERRKRNHQNVASEARSKVDDLNNTIANITVALSKYKETINYLDESLATSRRRPNPGPGAEAKRNELIAQRGQVQAQFHELQGVKQNAINARQRAVDVANSGGSSSGAGANGGPADIRKYFPNILPNVF